jgi:hypothetical protein
MRLFIASCTLLLSACTLPTQSRHGLANGAPLVRVPIALVLTDEDKTGVGEQAALAVAAELERRGYVIAPAADRRLEVALSIRPASTSVLGEAGRPVSRPRNSHRLRPCDGYVHRLAVAVYPEQGARSSQSAVTRGWAEQYRCSDQPAASLPVLARLAVRSLAPTGG